ncbi:hypothetical protein QBC40DRAFT_233894 [Triangularia verruculosa]|uniref:Rhodopsin domain-containing protein n=1 Tax=Triangularia verruculosa TaxID=2587418 RepID=A0AAN7ARQ2_9PEZI|nr:hypothetical protein QBC40DRAFT_233894 [Triangularia verruculosa]
MADAGPPSPEAIAAAMAAARTFNITLWTLYAIGVCTTALRTYSRLQQVGFANFETDDYLVWVAILFYTTQASLGYQIGNLAQGLANNGMTDEQRMLLLPSDPEWDRRVIGSKIQVMGWTCYSTLMLILKLAVLFFYLRLTNGLGRRYRMRVHAGFVLIIAGWLASVLAVFVGCLPFHKYWQINPNPGNSCQPAVSSPVVWASFAANVTSDIYLIIIPLPLLWGSRLRLVEKIGSTLVLSAGIFVLVCATLKTIFVVTDDVNGAELAGAWGTREAFVAVVTTNLPMVFPLFKAWLKPLFGSTSQRTTDNKYKTPDGFRSIGGGGAGGSNSRSQFRRGNGNSANIMTNVTFTESEERIVNEIKMQNMKTDVSGGPRTAHKDTSHKGIVVLTEFDVTEDARSVQHSDPGPPPARPKEAW